jgi:hypothetical protein
MNSRKILLVVFLLFLSAGISFNLTAQEKKVHVKVITNGKNTDSVYTVNYTTDSKGGGDRNVVIVRNMNHNGKSVESDDSIIELEVETPDIDVDEGGSGHHRVMIVRSGNGEDEDEMEDSRGQSSDSYSFSSSNCNTKGYDNDSSQKKGIRKRVMIQMDEGSNNSGGHHKMRYVMRSNGAPMGDMESEMEKIPLSASKDTTIMHISPQGDTVKIHRKVLKDGKIEQEVTVNKHSKDTIDNHFYAYTVSPGMNHMKMRRMHISSDSDDDVDFMMPPMPPVTGYDNMQYSVQGMPEGIDEKADFGRIKVSPVMGKNLVRISLDLSGKDNTVIKINDEKGKAVFEEKVKDLTGKYVRDIDMTGNEKGKYSLSVERGKSNITRQFTF